MGASNLIERVSREEYTGENRCLPCTVVNAALAVVGAGLLWALVGPWVGGIALVGAGLAIYLRGYLVPGTPELTQRYFPPWLLGLFGKDTVETAAGAPPSETAGTGTPETGRPLVDGGVLESDAERPSLTETFYEAWHERTIAVRADGVDSDAVARAFGADEAERSGGNSFVVDGNRSVRWGSQVTLAADVAAADLLEDRVPAWDGYDHERRRNVLQGLRSLLRHCPACGADLSRDLERVDPCCQKPHLVAEVVCDACDALVADVAVVDTGDIDSVAAALLAE